MKYPRIINFPDETWGLFFMQIFEDIPTDTLYESEYIFNAFRAEIVPSTGLLDVPSIEQMATKCKENIIGDIYSDNGEGEALYEFIVTAIPDDMLDSIIEETGCEVFNVIPASSDPFQISSYVNLIVDRVCHYLSNNSPLGPDIPFDLKKINEKWKTRQMIIGYISKIEDIKNGNVTNPKIQTLFYDLSKINYTIGEKFTIKNIMDWIGETEHE